MEKEFSDKGNPENTVVRTKRRVKDSKTKIKKKHNGMKKRIRDLQHQGVQDRIRKQRKDGCVEYSLE